MQHVALQELIDVSKEYGDFEPGFVKPKELHFVKLSPLDSTVVQFLAVSYNRYNEEWQPYFLIDRIGTSPKIRIPPRSDYVQVVDWIAKTDRLFKLLAPMNPQTIIDNIPRSHFAKLFDERRISRIGTINTMADVFRTFPDVRVTFCAD